MRKFLDRLFEIEFLGHPLPITIFLWCVLGLLFAWIYVLIRMMIITLSN